MKVLATRRYPGPAFDELADVEVTPLAELDGLRPDVEGLVVANEPAIELLQAFASWRTSASATTGSGLRLSRTRDRGHKHSACSTGQPPTSRSLILAVGGSSSRATARALGRLGLARGRKGDSPRRSRARRSGSSVSAGSGPPSRDVPRLRPPRPLHAAPSHRHRPDEFRELDALLARPTSSPFMSRSPRGAWPRRRSAPGAARDGACLVNTARGEIADERALVRELVSGRIRAGLDVFVEEPNVPVELLELPNVVLTPHLGATRQTGAMTRLVVDNLLAVERGRAPLTPVRPSAPARDSRAGRTTRLVACHDVIRRSMRRGNRPAQPRPRRISRLPNRGEHGDRLR